MSSPLPAPAGRSRLQIWMQAVRIFSFTASVIPILVGSGFALVDRSFDPLLFVLMLIASVACHAGANLANDYFDHVKGIDTAESLGPSKVIQQHLLTPAEVKRGMIVAFAIATVIGLVIVAQTGWPILALALASLAAAYFYTGGPKPLGYIALGEITVFIFMGPVMIGGAYWVLARTVEWQVIVGSLAVASLVALILHANNIRDIDLDRAAGKTTLATLLGRTGADAEFLALVAGAYLAIAALIAGDPAFWPLAVTALSLPNAIRLCRDERAAPDPRALNGVLRRSAGLHMRFGLLLVLGLLIRALIDRV